MSSTPHETDASLQVEPAGDAGMTRRLALGFLYWLPLMAALGLLAQVGILGLKPGLEERAFLDFEREKVEQRNIELREEYHGISQEVEAWQDPVYLERLRRWKALQDKD